MHSRVRVIISAKCGTCRCGNFCHLQHDLFGCDHARSPMRHIMSRPRFKNDLRALRLRSGLSQLELAKLLGVSDSAVCRYECGIRPITVLHLLACEIIFGVHATDILVPLRDKVEDAIGCRALGLHNSLEGRTDAVSVRKLQFLERLTRRMHEVRIDV